MGFHAFLFLSQKYFHICFRNSWRLRIFNDFSKSFSVVIVIKYALVLHPPKNKSKRRNGKLESNAQ